MITIDIIKKSKSGVSVSFSDSIMISSFYVPEEHNTIDGRLYCWYWCGRFDRHKVFLDD